MWSAWNTLMLAFCFYIFVGNHSGVVLSINSREMHSYLVSWYLQLNTKIKRLFSVSFYFSLVMSQNCKYGCKCWWRGGFLSVPWKKKVHHRLSREKDNTSCSSLYGLGTHYNWNSKYGSKFVALGTFNATLFLFCLCFSSLCLFLEGLTVTF